MKAHFPGEIREYLFSAVQGNSKESVGKRLGHHAERLLSVFRAYHLSESESVGVSYYISNDALSSTGRLLCGGGVGRRAYLNVGGIGREG